jgi:hypothetical protein
MPLTRGYLTYLYVLAHAVGRYLEPNFIYFGHIK